MIRPTRIAALSFSSLVFVVAAPGCTVVSTTSSSDGGAATGATTGGTTATTATTGATTATTGTTGATTATTGTTGATTATTGATGATTATTGSTAGSTGTTGSTTGAATGSDGGAGDGGNRDGGSAEGDCFTIAPASVTVQITGLPAGVLGKVSLMGPTDAAVAITATNTITGLVGGNYKVAADRVTDSDPLVRTLFSAEVDTASFSLCGSQMVHVTYTAIPSSNKLWTVNDTSPSADLTGFASAALATSGAPAASVAIKSPAGIDVAFDRDGNVWSAGPTVADPTLVRYAASQLGTSGTKQRDRAIAVQGIPCLPAVRGLAFDKSGNLWLSVCGGKVVRVSVAQLAMVAPGDAASVAPVNVTPDVVITAVDDKNDDIAFDATGNLWLADNTKAVRYDASRLTASTAAAPDRSLVITFPPGDGGVAPAPVPLNFLALDKSGNAWGVDFGGNNLFEISAANLTGTGSATVAATVSLALNVGALLDRPAIDDAGGIWIAWSSGKFARLAPSQLTVSTGAGSPTVPATIIASPDVGYATRMAFFPAAAGLPIYASQP